MLRRFEKELFVARKAEKRLAGPTGFDILVIRAIRKKRHEAELNLQMPIQGLCIYVWR